MGRRRTLLLIASILVAASGVGLIALYVRGADQCWRAGECRSHFLLGPSSTSIQPFTQPSGHPLVTPETKATFMGGGEDDGW